MTDDGSESMLDYAEELLGPRAVAEAGLFDPERVAKLVKKTREGQVVGVKDNMAFVGILSAQLVVDRFIKNFPKEHAP
jgi:asparagine synthase (glutamine-hydrolysing)